MFDTLSGVSDALRAVLDLHQRQSKTICGAVSMPVVHHHGAESDRFPGPLRTLTCSNEDGHEGDHKDAVCCYSFQTFEDWQVVDRKPRTWDTCSNPGCSFWPCATVTAIQKAAQ